MKTVIVILLFIATGALAIVGNARREKRRQRNATTPRPASAPLPKPQASKPADGECCGAHAVCERESLMNRSAEIIYYDDEELDVLADLAPDNYTETQLNMLQDVFDTLQEKDVAGWLRSLQTRRIQLPTELRDEALLIVSERRKA